MMTSEQVDLDVGATRSVAVVIVSLSDASNRIPSDVRSFPEGSCRETDSLKVRFFDLFFPAYERICLMNCLKKVIQFIFLIFLPQVSLSAPHTLF